MNEVEPTKCYGPDVVLGTISAAWERVGDPETDDIERLRLISALDGFDGVVSKILTLMGCHQNPTDSGKDW